MDKTIIKNTALNIYAVYNKKELLSLAIQSGLVVSAKRKGEIPLNFSGGIDVTECKDLDEKIAKITNSEAVCSIFEEYEYRKLYRYFCWFECSKIDIERLEEYVNSGTFSLYNKKDQRCVDEFNRPTVYTDEEQIYIKFSKQLKNYDGQSIKYIILAVIDKTNSLLEIRYDTVGVEYKSSKTFYEDIVNETLQYLENSIGLEWKSIDYQAVIDYIISVDPEDITFVAKRMERNGSRADLEVFDDEVVTIPILGEIDTFIKENQELFDKTEDTQLLRERLLAFKNEIEIQSDLPVVKIRFDKLKTKVGITHNFKNKGYSRFMIYGDLVDGKELMSNVKGYFVQFCKELSAAVSTEPIPAEPVQ